jgi:hypothetical protein
LEIFVGNLLHFVPCSSTFEDMPPSLTSLALERPLDFLDMGSKHSWIYRGNDRLIHRHALNATPWKFHHLAGFAATNLSYLKIAEMRSLEERTGNDDSDDEERQLLASPAETLSKGEKPVWSIKNRKINLPNSLVHLELGGEGSFNLDSIQCLPLGLEALIVRPFRILGLENLYPAETSLLWTGDHLMALPRGLKVLDLIPSVWRDESGQSKSLVTPPMLEFLPPQLQVFRFPDLIPTEEWVSQQQGWNFSEVNLAAQLHDYLHLLPHSITNLDISLAHLGYNIYPSHEKLLPTVSICRLQDTPILRLTSFPAKLRALSVLEDIGQCLPSLHVNGTQEEALRAIQKFGLPETLEYLGIRTRDSTVFTYFPNRLLTLHLSISFELLDKDILLLPASLTILEITRGADLLTDECIPALPHGLIKLSVVCSNEIKGERYPWPHKIQYLALAESSRNPRFPPFLTKVKLNSSDITDNSLMTLPRGLTSIDICNSTRLTGECIQFLPDSLISLKMTHLDFEDEHVALLPRGLRVVQCPFGGLDISDASVDDWPPIITTLAIRGSFITNAGLRRLPRSLVRLTLQDNELIDRSTARSCVGSKVSLFYIRGWSIIQ